MRKLFSLLFLIPLLASAQMVSGVWTLFPGSVDPGGAGGGVTSIIAGTGISVNQATGAVTITNTGVSTPGGVSGDWQYNNAGSLGGYTPATGWVTAFATPSSSNLAAWVTNETGSSGGGLLVFNNAPTIADATLTGTSTVSTANVTTVNVSTLQPASNDGAALGSTSRQFSDLFLAEGGVINWDNGDATITQTSNDITVAGITTFGVGTSTAVTLGTIEVGAASDTTISRSAAGVIAVEGVVIPSVSSTSTLTNKTVDFGATLGTDDTYVGEVMSGLNNSGGVTQWDAVYMNSSSAWVIADANGSGTYPARGLAVATASTGNATTVIVRGIVRNDGWSAWTVGAPIYLSGTAGAITQTVPATSGDKVQVIGYAIASKTIFVDFNSTYVTVQ